jgi:hypothetical protein
MFNKVDPIISQQAGIANQRGINLVLCCCYYATYVPDDTSLPTSPLFAFLYLR